MLMKKLLLPTVAALLLIGCSGPKWLTVNADAATTEQLIQKHFPQYYKLQAEGEITITKLESKQEDEGVKYRITYKDVYDEEDAELDALLWQTIYMPMLMD